MNENVMMERQVQCARICRLFRSVLKRAACDAFGPKCRKMKRKKIREKARDFLTENDDFLLICKMAFVNPKLILSVVSETKLKNIEKYRKILLIIKDNYYNYFDNTYT